MPLKYSATNFFVDAKVIISRTCFGCSFQWNTNAQGVMEKNAFHKKEEKKEMTGNLEMGASDCDCQQRFKLCLPIINSPMERERVRCGILQKLKQLWLSHTRRNRAFCREKNVSLKCIFTVCQSQPQAHCLNSMRCHGHQRYW